MWLRLCCPLPPAGQDEGAFAWLTLNYLLERLGTGPEATVSAIDLGGGSVQVSG
jgi:apyrase